MPTVDNEGTSISFQVQGSGPALLLIAGTGYPASTWHPRFLDLLAESFQVITFDHRGTGASPGTDHEYSTELFARDAAAVLGATTSAPAHVLGHSMGGRVAQWLAIDEPSRVDRLVLAATGAGVEEGVASPRIGVPVSTAYGVATAGLREYVGQLQRSTFFTEECVERQDPMVAWLEGAFWAHRPPLLDYLKHVVARQSHSSRGRIHEISARTLVLVGDRDTHVGGTGSHVAQSEELTGLLKDSELVVLRGVKHGFFWEALDESADVVGQWLRGER